MAEAKTLPKEIFNVEVKNYELIDLAYKSYLAGGRNNPAVTLKRGEVRGGGKKPWRQKGTGRARIGSIRAPHWRGGGVTFGPSGKENYTLNLSKTMRRVAIRQALSLANKSGQVQVADIKVERPKTKDALALLTKLKAEGRVLVVISEKDEAIQKSFANLQNVKLVTARHLNVFDVMNADSIIIETKALSLITEWLGGK